MEISFSHFVASTTARGDVISMKMKARLWKSGVTRRNRYYCICSLGCIIFGVKADSMNDYEDLYVEQRTFTEKTAVVTCCILQLVRESWMFGFSTVKWKISKTCGFSQKDSWLFSDC